MVPFRAFAALAPHRVAALFLLGLLGGCESPATLPPLSFSEQQELLASAPAAPRLQGGDKIRVTVFGEDKLTGEFEIDPGGFVSLPLAGTIRAVGLTKTELEQDLSKRFKSDYLRNPKVTVDIATFLPFYVLGEVEKPGEYPFKSGMNVMSAIAVAGGNTYRASKTQVLIQRSGERGLREYPLSSTIPVQPGDLIRVPERYF